MNNRQQHMLSRKALFLSLPLMVLVLAPYTQGQSRPARALLSTPAAVVKSIVINDLEQREADRNRATVTRAGSGKTDSVSAGMFLYRNDIIETFDATDVTLLFLDAPVSERDNEVIVKANSKVGISSTISWWGKIWVKVKGSFNSNSTYVRLSATGTEYQLDVTQGEQRPTVILIEGSLHFEKGTFTLAGLEQTNIQTAELTGSGSGSTFPLVTDFAHAVSAQVQTGHTLDVKTGQFTDFSGTYHVLNDCRRTHYFEFRTSNTSWLHLAVQQQAEIPPHVSLPVEATVRIDATQLSPGQYRADIYAICLDCKSEPNCTQFQLDWPLNVTVRPDLTPKPQPPASLPAQDTLGSSTQTGEIGTLQEMTFTSALDRQARALDSHVLSVLDWTNNVILTTQPTYSAQNIIPHFTTVEQRSQRFKQAREGAVLRNEAGSNAALGNVYSDWGQAAQAVFAYEKEIPSGSGQETFQVDKAEAYRLTGKLDIAEKTLGRLSATDSQSIAAQNAYGNLNLDYATIAMDQRDSVEAKRRVDAAREHYNLASQATQITTGKQVGPRAGMTVQTNLGEIYLAEGNIEIQRDREKARTSYSNAARQLESVQQANSQYPFPITDLGRAYQGLGNVAQLDGNASEANAEYDRAERQQNQAIAAHKDFAEAYFNLGDLFDDRGDKEAAKENYWMALKTRPEQPAPYYPLALLIQKENPQLAATLAATYLQLEPEAFKHGEKATNARSITQGHYVDPPRRPMDITPQPIPPGPIVPPPIPGTVPPAGAVPNVLNMNSAQALSAIEVAGFVPGRIQAPKNKPEYIVTSQTPAADTPAARGSAIDLVLEKGIEVPDTTDDGQQKASKKISDRRLKIGTTEQQEDCRPAGNVVRSNPPRHTRVAPGTVVNLVVASLGEDPLKIPNFLRRPQDEAEATIRNLQLRYPRLRLRNVRKQETDQAEEGNVFKQTPAGESQFAKNCPVNIDLTIAIPWTIVGNYVTLTLDEVQQQLSAINLTAAVNYQDTASDFGKVIYQSPQAGSKVSRGTQVTLTVSKEAQMTWVPDLYNRDVEVAKQAIQNANLTVGTITQKAPDFNHPFADNAVMSQDPPAGQRVRVGTQVNLVVAKNIVIN